MNPINFLRNLPVFQDLQERDWLHLSSIIKDRVLPKHEYIYKEEEKSDQIFFLIKGIIKIGTHSDDGREVIKHILHPMAMFGELSLIGELTRNDFAISMTDDVRICSMKTTQFFKLMEMNHLLSMRLLKTVGKRLRKAEERLESLIFKDARERIIDFLKNSAEQQGKKIGYEMLIKHCLTQQDIANITGTSRQTVTSVLNDLRKSNLIYFNRRSILIRDIGRLS